MLNLQSQSNFKTMEIQGKITTILPIKSGQSKDGKDWSNQTIAIETEGQYPKTVALQLSGKSLDYNKDKIKVGQVITAKFDVSSREYNGQYYTTLGAYNVDIHAFVEASQESSVHELNLNPNGLDLPF
jgi:hypothetical protein